MKKKPLILNEYYDNLKRKKIYMARCDRIFEYSSNVCILLAAGEQGVKWAEWESKRKNYGLNSPFNYFAYGFFTAFG